MSNTPLDSLHTIPLPVPFPGLDAVNVYLADGDPLTLFDTGLRWKPGREALETGLGALGYRIEDIGRIIVSHSHVDHFGLAGQIIARSGAEIWSHPYNIPWMADLMGERAKYRDFYLKLYGEGGVPRDILEQVFAILQGFSEWVDNVTVTHAIDDGDTLEMAGHHWQVLHTPGHSQGVICLYQPDTRVLLSSDHLLPKISSNPIVEPPQAGQERPRKLMIYIEQLKRIAAMNVSVALPGHGEPIDDHRALVAERLAFHEQRAEQVLDALGDGERTLFELAQVLFPRLDAVNAFLSFSEVLGHLDILEVTGRARQIRRDGLVYWQEEPLTHAR
jgi:glyoxylase-like metal-dependent hydrolase (beta-lactamase superfamily II)